MWRGANTNDLSSIPRFYTAEGESLTSTKEHVHLPIHSQWTLTHSCTHICMNKQTNKIHELLSVPEQLIPNPFATLVRAMVTSMPWTLPEMKPHSVLPSVSVAASALLWAVWHLEPMLCSLSCKLEVPLRSPTPSFKSLLCSPNLLD